VCPLARARLLGAERGSQIARASCARSCERASSARSEGAARRAVRRGAKDREHARTANRDKGKRTSRSAPARRVRHTARRVRRTPARCARASPAGGLGERSEGSRSARGAGGSPGRPFRPRTRTASSEGARRSDSPRAARVAPCAMCTARPRVVRTPPARGGARERRARNDATRQQSDHPSDQPACEIQTVSSEGARRSDFPHAARVASRVACAARPLVMRAPPPACGWIEGAPRAERRNERREEKSTTRATSLLDCGGENHPRRTRATRIARASPVAMHAGEDPFRTKRRPKRRRETRTTTGDRRRREAPQRDLARLRRREPPIRAPRGAGALARARLLARHGRLGAARRQQEESPCVLSPAEWRTTNNRF